MAVDSFFYFLLMFFLDLCVFTYFGQFLVFLTPSQGMAQIIASGELPLFWLWSRVLKPCHVKRNLALMCKVAMNACVRVHLTSAMHQVQSIIL